MRRRSLLASRRRRHAWRRLVPIAHSRCSRRSRCGAQEMVDEACVEPKERKMYKGLGEKTKARRKEQKRRRSDVKKDRKVTKNDW